MGQDDLQTASSYINNALISRGLLRKGQEIQWAQPKNHSAGTGGTMVKIIRLVNDLIVDRDRDEQHREALADTIQQVRASEQKRGVEIGRIQARNKELERSLSLSKNQENALKESAKKAAATVRDLQTQINRYKSDLDKSRVKYANDNSRRDLDIGKLRRQLVELQRSKKEGYGLNIRQGNTDGGAFSGAFGKGIKGSDDKAQTNAILAEQLDAVCKEAEALGFLVKDTIRELKRMTDLRSSRGKTIPHVQADESQSYHLGSFDVLSAEVLAALMQCRSVLEDPSFISVESVEEAFKEQESYIKELRNGWEMMADRLRQTQEMMVHWKERMMDGDSINLNDLGTGLRLGESVMPPLFEESFLSSLSTVPVIPNVTETVESAPRQNIASRISERSEMDEFSQVALDESFKQSVDGIFHDNSHVAGLDDISEANGGHSQETAVPESADGTSQTGSDDQGSQGAASAYKVTSPPKRGVSLKKQSPQKPDLPKPVTTRNQNLFSTSPKPHFDPKFSIESDDASLLSLQRSGDSLSVPHETTKKAIGPGVFTRLSQPKSQTLSRAASATTNPPMSHKKASKPAKKQPPLFPGISPLKSATKVNLTPSKPLSISEKLAAAKQEAEEAENSGRDLDTAVVAGSVEDPPGLNGPTGADGASSFEAFDEWGRAAAIGEEEGNTMGAKAERRRIGKRKYGGGRGRKSTLCRAELDSLLVVAAGGEGDGR